MEGGNGATSGSGITLWRAGLRKLPEKDRAKFAKF